MSHRIKMATVCLHISAVLYVLISIGSIAFILFFPMEEVEEKVLFFVMFIFMAVFCLVLAAGIEVVVWAIKRRKFWSWVTGLVIFGLYIPSLFLPLGALGLWGLLDSGSRKEFGIGIHSGKGNTGNV